MPRRPEFWVPARLSADKPAYIAIADAIHDDLRDGMLKPGDQLPPQRLLAHEIGLNFTTVSRAYAEARHRGLVEGRVGQGTFVRGEAPLARQAANRARIVDMSMNLPPEPSDPALLARMARGAQNACGDIVSVLRYAPFGGSEDDKAAGLAWLARRGVQASHDTLLVCPGTHAILNGLLSALAGPEGGRICCDAITYPGIKALAALHGVSLVGLPADADGMLPDAFDEACRTARPTALYLNPTLHNPTTRTIPVARREALVEVARRHAVTIIEDDPYSLLLDAPPPSFFSLMPERTYYIGSLSKTVGAGLRIAYLALPDARQAPRLGAIMRAVSVMPPPMTLAVATQWIEDGTAVRLLEFVREESRARQALVAEALRDVPYLAAPEGFHLWLPLPEGWSRVSFATHLRNSGIGVVTSDAFLVSGAAIEAVRVCLGGRASRHEVVNSLEVAASALSHPPAIYSSIV